MLIPYTVDEKRRLHRNRARLTGPKASSKGQGEKGLTPTRPGSRALVEAGCGWSAGGLKPQYRIRGRSKKP